MAEEVEFEAPWASQDAQATDNTAQAPESEGLTFPFSPTYFEFATDRYGPYDGLSNALPNLNMFGQPSSFFQSKDNRNPSIDDIDNYMVRSLGFLQSLLLAFHQVYARVIFVLTIHRLYRI